MSASKLTSSSSRENFKFNRSSKQSHGLIDLIECVPLFGYIIFIAFSKLHKQDDWNLERIRPLRWEADITKLNNVYIFLASAKGDYIYAIFRISEKSLEMSSWMSAYGNKDEQ